MCLSASGHSLTEWAIDINTGGLLRAVALCGAANKFQVPLGFLLEKVLPRHLIYDHVVQSMEEEIYDVEDLVGQETLEASGIFTQWNRFRGLAFE
jgi:hypothetical protein